MPSISVVIPTYNGEKYIAEAIDSVLNQTSPPDEIIVSDDNSKDSTLEICERYDDKIKIFKNPNGPSGFVNGWNTAIAHAKGDYISILHQDDKLAPTFIEEIRNAIKGNPDVKHLFASCQYIDSNGEIIQTEQLHLTGEIHRYSGQEYVNDYECIKGHVHRCPGVVTHKSIFDACKYREEAGHIADDDFFLRVGNYTDIIGILKPLAFYREHSGSETGRLGYLALNERLLKDYLYQLRNYKNNKLITDEIINLFRINLIKSINRLVVGGIKDRRYNYVSLGIATLIKFTLKERGKNLKYYWNRNKK